jgi:hypothetical protein
MFSTARGRQRHSVAGLILSGWYLLLMGFLGLSITPLSAMEEAVKIIKVDERARKAVLQRGNGEQWEIEYGTGALNMRRYAGRAIMLDIPGSFGNIADRFTLPGGMGDIKIWKSRQIRGPGSSEAGAFGEDDGEPLFYDAAGNPIAYLAPGDDGTIYLWNGTPAAYIAEDSGTMTVFGFNGKHLGWYIDGLLVDTKGFLAGFHKGTISTILVRRPDTLKGAKGIRPVKSLRMQPPHLPDLRRFFGDISLADFLAQGVDPRNLPTGQK